MYFHYPNNQNPHITKMQGFKPLKLLFHVNRRKYQYTKFYKTKTCKQHSLFLPTLKSNTKRPKESTPAHPYRIVGIYTITQCIFTIFDVLNIKLGLHFCDLTRSYRASAVMSRRTLEAITVDKGETEGVK